MKKHFLLLEVLMLAQKEKSHRIKITLNNSLGRHCIEDHITSFHETNTVVFFVLEMEQISVFLAENQVQ